MMRANFFPWWSGSFIVVRRSFTHFEGRVNLPTSKVLMAESTLSSRLSSGARPLQKKRIAWALLSQPSLACQSGLTEMSILYQASSKALRAICLWGISVSSGSISMQTFHRGVFLTFLFQLHWERSPPTAISRSEWSRAGNVRGTFSSRLFLLQSVSSDYIVWVACGQVCGYDFQWTHTYRRSHVAKGLEEIGLNKCYVECTIFEE